MLLLAVQVVLVVLVVFVALAALQPLITSWRLTLRFFSSAAEEVKTAGALSKAYATLSEAKFVSSCSFSSKASTAAATARPLEKTAPKARARSGREALGAQESRAGH